MFERSLQKQMAHILSKGGNAATLLVSPYQVAVAKDKEADQRLACKLKEYEEVQNEKVRLQMARVKVLEVMDKVGDIIEGSQEAEVAGAYGNPFYLDDDGYFREEIKSNVFKLIERLK